MTSEYDALNEIRQSLQNKTFDDLFVTAKFIRNFELLFSGQLSTEDLVGITEDFTLSARRSIVLVDATDGIVEVTLPDPAEVLDVNAGTTKLFLFKKVDGSANLVRILPNDTELIEGGANYELTAVGGAVILVTDGDNWYEMASNAAGGGGSVTSVFGRTGGVLAQASDYDAVQVDFTADGDIAATDVQAAIVEVRDDTDVKLALKADSATLTSHTSDTANPHSTDVGNLGSGTLAELNAAITDATLDDSSAARTPTAHAASHLLAGSDEIDGDRLDIDYTPSSYTPDISPVEVSNVDHLTAHPAGIDVELTSFGSHIADATNPHGTDVGNLGSGTLAELNVVITDATLDDSSAARTPTAHAASHITGGGDEIDGDQLDIDWNPSNYTPTTSPAEVTSLDHLTAHLAGIDAALAASTEFADDVFRVQDNLDATKQIAFQASGITTATTRTITMPDADVDLTLVNSHASRHITGGADEIDGDQLDIDFTPSNYTPATTPTEVTNLDHLTAHLYGIDQELGGGGGVTVQTVTTSTATIGSGDHRVLVETDTNVVTLTLPASPTVGDYITIEDIDYEGHIRPITINRAGSQLINGETSYVMDEPGQKIALTYVATNLWRLERLQVHDDLQYIRLDEHYVSGRGNTSGRYIFEGATGGGGSFARQDSFAGHPGVMQLNTTGSGQRAQSWIQSSTGAGDDDGILFGNGPVMYSCYFRIPTLADATDDFACLFGFFMDGNDSGPDPCAIFIINRVFFGTDIYAVTRDTVGQTETDTTVNISANTWTKFTIAVNAAGTSFHFLIDDTLAVTLTTTEPASTRSCGTEIIRSAGTNARNIEIDRQRLIIVDET